MENPQGSTALPGELLGKESGCKDVFIGFHGQAKKNFSKLDEFHKWNPHCQVD